MRCCLRSARQIPGGSASSWRGTFLCAGQYMAERFLPYGRQAIDDDDIDAIVAALRSDYLTTGPAIAAYEAAFAARTGAGHAVACSSGTAGLHLAAMAIGLKPGDAAIVPTMTFLATANCVRYMGADVLFADVD